MSVNTVSTQTLSFDEIVAKEVENKQRENDVVITALRTVLLDPPNVIIDNFTKKIFTDPCILSCCDYAIEIETMNSYLETVYFSHERKVELLADYPKVPCPNCEKQIHPIKDLKEDKRLKELCRVLQKISENI